MIVGEIQFSVVDRQVTAARRRFARRKDGTSKGDMRNCGWWQKALALTPTHRLLAVIARLEDSAGCWLAGFGNGLNRLLAEAAHRPGHCIHAGRAGRLSPGGFGHVYQVGLVVRQARVPGCRAVNKMSVQKIVRSVWCLGRD